MVKKSGGVGGGSGDLAVIVVEGYKYLRGTVFVPMKEYTKSDKFVLILQKKWRDLYVISGFGYFFLCTYLFAATVVWADRSVCGDDSVYGEKARTLRCLMA